MLFTHLICKRDHPHDISMHSKQFEVAKIASYKIHGKKVNISRLRPLGDELELGVGDEWED